MPNETQPAIVPSPTPIAAPAPLPEVTVEWLEPQIDGAITRSPANVRCGESVVGVELLLGPNLSLSVSILERAKEQVLKLEADRLGTS